MIKLMNMLIRDDDCTHEEFVGRWRGSHAELAKGFPGLVRYTTSVPTNPERSEYDGIVELYLESMVALKTASDSGVGQRVSADTAAFIDMEQGPTLYVGEAVHPDRS